MFWHFDQFMENPMNTLNSFNSPQKNNPSTRIKGKVTLDLTY